MASFCSKTGNDCRINNNINAQKELQKMEMSCPAREDICLSDVGVTGVHGVHGSPQEIPRLKLLLIKLQHGVWLACIWKSCNLKFRMIIK
jgi:hypothetical protein